MLLLSVSFVIGVEYTFINHDGDSMRFISTSCGRFERWMKGQNLLEVSLKGSMFLHFPPALTAKGVEHILHTTQHSPSRAYQSQILILLTCYQNTPHSLTNTPRSKSIHKRPWFSLTNRQPIRCYLTLSILTQYCGYYNQ